MVFGYCFARAVNFYSLSRVALQSAVLSWRVVANVVAEYGVWETVFVALTTHLVAFGVYAMLVLIPFLVETMSQSAEESSLSGLVFWYYWGGRDVVSVAVAIASVGISG